MPEVMCFLVDNQFSACQLVNSDVTKFISDNLPMIFPTTLRTMKAKTCIFPVGISPWRLVQ